jgi:hypothetical protein
MRRTYPDEDDALARQQLADAMNHAHAPYLPAPASLGNDFRQRLLGHPRIVLQRHRRHVTASDQANETGHRASVRITRRQGGDFGADVEVGFLNGDLFHPPVTGGKNATSSPSATGASMPHIF